MTDAPERIWAGRWPHGGRAWRDVPSDHIKTAYVRADLVDALEVKARLEGWRAGLEAAADCAEDYCSDMPDLAGHGHSVGLRDAIRALPGPACAPRKEKKYVRR